MKKLIAFILAFFLASPVFAVTEDQEELSGYILVTGSAPQSFVTPPTVGCTMVVAGTFAGSGADMAFASPEVNDSDGNTYTVVQSAAGGFNKAMVAVAHLTAVTPPFSVTIETAALFAWYGNVVFKSFCGLANPASDKTATAADPGPQGSDATLSTTATAQANETIIAALAICELTDSNLNITAPTPATYTPIFVDNDCTTSQPGGVWWKNVTSTGVQTATWTHDDVTSSGTYNGWAAVIVTLNDAVAGGAVARRRSAVVIQ